MVQGGRPCTGALGLVLLPAPEQESEYISLRPSNFTNTYFIHCVMDVHSLDAALTGSRTAKGMNKNVAHLKCVYTCSSTCTFLHTYNRAPTWILNTCLICVQMQIWRSIFRSYLTLTDCSAPVMAPILYCFTVTRSQRLGACTSPWCSMWSAGVTQTALIVCMLQEELAELWRLSVRRSRELLSWVATVNGSKCRINRFLRQTCHTSCFWIVFMSI